jgi:rhamnose transport system permease protein
MSAHAGSVPRRIRRFSREGALLVVLVILTIVMSQLSPYFLTTSNLLDTTRLFTESGLIALGMTLVIITGGIDISVGSILGLSSITLGLLYQDGVPLPIAIMCAIVVGVLCGLGNGLLVTRLALHPLAITLATLALYRGVAFGIAGPHEVSTFPSWFEYVGQYYIGQIPGQFIVLVIAAVVVAFLLARTRIGRYVYAVGSNERAVEFAGVSVARVKVFVYMATGLLAGIAAVIYTSRVSTARADAGTGLELFVIASVVLGGASIYGGSGSIIGTALGVLILAVLQNGLALAAIDANWIQFAIGLTLIGGVLVNQWLQKSES